MPWKNFQIWRGRLPHWRADDVTYYVTFRHRRPLSDQERSVLFRTLFKPEGKKIDFEILCVLPEATEMVFAVRDIGANETLEFSDVVEKAKIRAGKLIIKSSGERFPPFFVESYDRIIRDEAELEERLLSILGSPVDHELVEDPSEYECLYVRNA
ncbi:MAG: hypothetical protein JST40_04510 [Armatimonadetes bacterium]|nr:hypothetical protein [Armatimonadota bacterium]